MKKPIPPKEVMPSLEYFITRPFETKSLFSKLLFFVFIVSVGGAASLFAIFEVGKYEKAQDYIDSSKHALYNTYSKDTTQAGDDSLMNKVESLKIFEQWIEQDRSQKLKYYFWYPISIISFILLLFYFSMIYETNKLSFHCTNPECHKVIYFNQLPNIQCPSCNKDGISILKLIQGKCKCETKLKYLECPHCLKEINLFKPYDHKKIKEKIYNS